MPRKRLENPTAVTQYDSNTPTGVPHGSGPQRVSPGSYEGEVRAALMELGANDPDILLRASGDFWKHCKTMGLEPKVTAAIVYGSERHRHEVTRTSIQEANDARRGTPGHGTASQGEASQGKVLAYEGDPSAMGGTSEMAPVVSEDVAPVVSEGPIPWRKVERNPDTHAADMKLAERYGAITDARKVYEVVGEAMSKEDQECFVVLPLNVRGELKCAPIEVGRGQRSRVTVDAVDVVRAAIVSGAEGFCVVHNHPTGKCKPSDADIKLTEALKKATAAMGPGLTMVDHVVVGHGEVYSIESRKLYKIKP